MKWFGPFWAAVSEYFKFRNRTPQKEIDAREAEKTETKGLKSDIKQIKLKKRELKRFEKFYNWAKRNDYIKKDEDKHEAYERFKRERQAKRK